MDDAKHKRENLQKVKNQSCATMTGEIDYKSDIHIETPDGGLDSRA